MEKRGLNHIAFRCTSCGTVNVFSKQTADGHKCKVCGGYLVPVDDAIVINKPMLNNSIEIEVKSKGLDKILTELREANAEAQNLKATLESIQTRSDI